MTSLWRNVRLHFEVMVKLTLWVATFFGLTVWCFNSRWCHSEIISWHHRMTSLPKNVRLHFEVTAKLTLWGHPTFLVSLIWARRGIKLLTKASLCEASPAHTGVVTQTLDMQVSHSYSGSPLQHSEVSDEHYDHQNTTRTPPPPTSPYVIHNRTLRRGGPESPGSVTGRYTHILCWQFILKVSTYQS